MELLSRPLQEDVEKPRSPKPLLVGCSALCPPLFIPWTLQGRSKAVRDYREIARTNTHYASGWPGGDDLVYPQPHLDAGPGRGGGGRKEGAPHPCLLGNADDLSVGTSVT